MKRKDKAAIKAVGLRCLVHILKVVTPSNIWLITDKADRADDNGEAFFGYCMKNRKEIGCYPVFAVGKNTPDYKRIKKIGPVVPYMSWMHKVSHLLACHTISAYSHNEISSPFYNYGYYYSDMMQNNKIVFLQHGVTKDDVSKGLNRRLKNFSLFITSAEEEYDSILNYNYGYTEKHVALTGMPRYDRLYDKVEKIVTIMPTWRRNLFGKYDAQTSKWELLPGFEESDYYKFYKGLLNHTELHRAAHKNGYKIQLLIHPVLFPYIELFDFDDRVKILDSSVVYRDVFAESALLLTDYSSVAFDMAYLRKPVIYTHFDSNHYVEGYFNYETDGFGEVEYTLEETIARIIEYMETSCQLKHEYCQRINKFFTYDDKENCDRVCKSILELDKIEK